MSNQNNLLTTGDIVRHVKDAIIRGKLSPGQKLVEARLCRELDVGRSRMREALFQLEQEGFVQRIPNASPVVKEISQADISHIYDLLGVLEGLSMRIATLTISSDDIQYLEICIEKMEQYDDDVFKIAKYNFNFHDFMTQLGGNGRLINFADQIRTQASRLGLHSFYNPQQVNSSFEDHRNIFEAIKDRKPQKVENRIRSHYLTSKNRLLTYINKTL
jgi:DNA-binding GntR family transcriptional regulator